MGSQFSLLSPDAVSPHWPYPSDAAQTLPHFHYTNKTQCRVLTNFRLVYVSWRTCAMSPPCPIPVKMNQVSKDPPLILFRLFHCFMRKHQAFSQGSTPLQSITKDDNTAQRTWSTEQASLAQQCIPAALLSSHPHQQHGLCYNTGQLLAVVCTDYQASCKRSLRFVPQPFTFIRRVLSVTQHFVRT